MSRTFSQVFGAATTIDQLDPQRVYDAIMAGEVDFQSLRATEHMQISQALAKLDPQQQIGAFYVFSTSLSRALNQRDDALTDEVTAIEGRKKLSSEMKVSMFTSLCGGGDDATPPVFMILDLDGFKAINDTLGHKTGDAVLAEFASRLSGAFEDTEKPHNRVYRMGGDEFAIIVHDMDQQEAYAAARQAISNFVVEGGNGVRLPVSASIGTALFQQRRKDDTADAAISSVMSEADEQVYAEKDTKLERLDEVLRATPTQMIFQSQQPL